MRTTIILDDLLATKIKPFASKRGLSEFVNECLREHFEKLERKKQLLELEKAYARAARGSQSSSDFEMTDLEEWPEW